MIDDLIKTDDKLWRNKLAIPLGLTQSRFGYIAERTVLRIKILYRILNQKAHCTGMFVACETQIREMDKTIYMERLTEDIHDIKIENILALCRLGKLHATQSCASLLSPESDQDIKDEHNKIENLLDEKKTMDLKERLTAVSSISEKIFPLCALDVELADMYMALCRLLRYKSPDFVFLLQLRSIDLIDVLPKLESLLSGLRPYRQKRTITKKSHPTPNIATESK